MSQFSVRPGNGTPPGYGMQQPYGMSPLGAQGMPMQAQEQQGGLGTGAIIAITAASLAAAGALTYTGVHFYRKSSKDQANESTSDVGSISSRTGNELEKLPRPMSPDNTRRTNHENDEKTSDNNDATDPDDATLHDDDDDVSEVDSEEQHDEVPEPEPEPQAVDVRGELSGKGVLSAELYRKNIPSIRQHVKNDQFKTISTKRAKLQKRVEAADDEPKLLVVALRHVIEDRLANPKEFEKLAKFDPVKHEKQYKKAQNAFESKKERVNLGHVIGDRVQLEDHHGKAFDLQLETVPDRHKEMHGQFREICNKASNEQALEIEETVRQYHEHVLVPRFRGPRYADIRKSAVDQGFFKRS